MYANGDYEMVTTPEDLANRRSGVIESAIRKLVAPGAILHTVPARAPFEVRALSERALVLLFGRKKTRTNISWPCLESTMWLLTHGDWVEIRSVHDTTGVRGSLDGHLKANGGPRRTVGGYVAAVLEAARIVEVDSSRPARIRLNKTIVENGNGPPARADASEADRSEPFAQVFGALKGTVVIAPGTDLTAPVGEEWGAAR